MFNPSDINPYREMALDDMSPTDFENYCLEILKGYGEKEQLQEFTILHNQKIQAYDGTYQIDVYAEFTALGSKFKVIAECKQYKSPVSRDKLEILENRIRSIGAHKGILLSTAGFQSGAVEYAAAHGIALIQIFDKSVQFIMQAYKPDEKLLFIMREMQRRYPKYIGWEWTDIDLPNVTVYPTESMIKQYQDEISELLLRNGRNKNG